MSESVSKTALASSGWISYKMSSPTKPVNTYVSPGTATVERMSKWGHGEWGSPAVILIALVMLALVVVGILYFATTVFATGGKLASSGWVSFGGGTLLMGLFALMMVGAGATVALTMKENMWALGVGAAIIATLGILVYFMLGAVRDDDGVFFLITSVIAIVGSLIAVIYGFWTLYKAHNVAAKEENAVDKANVESRYKWSMATAAVGVIGVIGSGAAAVHIYRAIP